jgi:hypothetical protein
MTTNLSSIKNNIILKVQALTRKTFAKGRRGALQRSHEYPCHLSSWRDMLRLPRHSHATAGRVPNFTPKRCPPEWIRDLDIFTGAGKAPRTLPVTRTSRLLKEVWDTTKRVPPTYISALRFGPVVRGPVVSSLAVTAARSQTHSVSW